MLTAEGMRMHKVLCLWSTYFLKSDRLVYITLVSKKNSNSLGRDKFNEGFVQSYIDKSIAEGERFSV